MTSLLQAINDAPDTLVGVATSTAARRDAAPASDEALRLALQLRGTGTTSGGRALLFVPASPTAAAARVASEAVRGLLALHEGAVLVMDLRPGAAADRGAADGGSGQPAVMTPFAGRTDTVRYAASAEFAGKLAEARARYSYILCIGAPLDSSVETLVTAALCDGVILAVAPNRTTRADMQRVSGELRRRHANLLGFVLDAREAEKGA